MNEIKITHELCAEDRKRIDDLAHGLGYLAGLVSQLLQGAPYKIDTDKPNPDPLDTIPEEIQPVEVTAEDHPVENPFIEAPKKEEPKAPEHTKDEVRKLVVTLSAKGKKAEARDIVLAHSTSITDLPEKDIDAVYNALKALED